MEGKSPKIKYGDFNASTLQWGNLTMNVRERVALELFTELKVVFAFKGKNYILETSKQFRRKSKVS